jgi:hypothetical protein
MTPDRHRIQRQIVELTLGDAASAPGAQVSLARACRESLLAGMTSVFDAVAPADVLLRLDRLEIDVGRLVGHDWTEQLQSRVVAELERQLERPREAGKQRTRDEAEQRGGDFEAFVHFLRRGRLPWWGGAPRAGWSNVVAETSPGQLRALRTMLGEEARARARVVDALDDMRLEEMIAGCGLPGGARAMRELRVSVSPAIHHRWRRMFWQRVLEYALAPGVTMAGGPELVRLLMMDRCALALEPGQVGRDDPEPASAGSPAAIRPVDLAALPQPWREWCEVAGSIEVADEPAAMRATADGGAARHEKSARPARPASGAPAEEAEAIYLPCAGILLLHPFLETLFRDRELLEGRRFANDASRQRAAQLLGYLATGRADTPEYELGVAKLLTGIDADTPIESAWLGELDITACDRLLAAVLGHWTALRSSSAAWLRSQFFLRDARLDTVDGGHRVTVERRAQDVLLARLPWGFGVISLPWLPEKIFVQWLD